MSRRASWAIVHREPYRRGNSPATLTHAARVKKPTDVDVQPCRDDLLAAHWRVPALDGMLYTRASTAHGIPASKVGKPCRRPLRTVPVALALTLASADGYRYHRLEDMIAHAARVGADLELEPKVLLSVRNLTRMRDWCAAAYGPDWSQRVYVKRLARINGRVVVGWRRLLLRAHRLGFRTIALRVPRDPRLPYVDFFRP